MTDPWDAMTPAQRERVLWLTSQAKPPFNPRITAEELVRAAVNAYAEVIDLQVGRFTSKAFLEDQRIRAYDSGWDDGHQAGKDEALDAIEQLAKAKAEVAG